jgi:hypothetical protein
MSIEPYAALNKWLRDHPRANMAHLVLHYQERTLMAYCGRKFPADEASAQIGVVLCSRCLLMSQGRRDGQLNRLRGKYARRIHNGHR